ncbi:MAG: hypothetical protein JSS51_03465 [Planctomycetes bacterium]|nr:hypothetical protein [Planctomycetota bacterium]
MLGELMLLAGAIIIGAVIILAIHHAGWKRGKRHGYRCGWNDAHFPNARYRGNE